MNNKGQALVEFVLILPIFLFILLAIYDFGRIFNERNILENRSNDIILMYKNGDDVREINEKYEDYTISITDSGDYIKFNISSDINIITPGLGRIFGEPYMIVIERYIPNE